MERETEKATTTKEEKEKKIHEFITNLKQILVTDHKSKYLGLLEGSRTERGSP